MFLFPKYADTASRDAGMADIDPADLDPDDRAMFEESGLDIDQWIDPDGLGGYIRYLRAVSGEPWENCAALINPWAPATPVPIFVARCWAIEDLIRTRRTLRQIRRAHTEKGGISNG